MAECTDNCRLFCNKVKLVVPATIAVVLQNKGHSPFACIATPCTRYLGKNYPEAKDEFEELPEDAFRRRASIRINNLLNTNGIEALPEVEKIQQAVIKEELGITDEDNGLYI